ncbi:hypothetical protein [Bacillus sp. es.036]|uniref:hypothetical protein n=1 Tax=Bacillus sp. es.036 TaxID=1761764 RepID=UPI000BF877AF|nr:hypothetical protein [Bacillus sp. es.036]PFG14652.1 hypothetical protein ATG70_2888 [Bacillus sp. es.036]
MKRPLGVTLISYFYLFGAVVLLITAIFYDAGANTIGIAERFGLPNAPERLMRILVALLSFVMVYGYIRLTNWGYWFMIAYSIIFGCISALLISNISQQPFLGNVIFSIVVLIYTIYVRKSFRQSSRQGT